MNWKSRKVLVTGAGGFIGSHLCESLLELEAEVTAMIHYSGRSDWGNLEFLPPERKKELQVVGGNIEDCDFVSRQVRGKDVVFHLAALIAIPYSYLAPRSYVRTNVEGTLNVLEAARAMGVSRVVHTSTSETYGTAQYTPIDEKHMLQGQSPYSASKIAADKMAESYSRSFALPVTTIRPFNTFGPRQSGRAIIPTIISQALTKDVINLGSLDPVRDLNFVKDVVLGFLRVAESEAALGQVVNIGSGRGITVGDLALLILKLLKCEKPLVQDQARLRPPDSEVYTLICDNRKALELTGWKPFHSLEEGLTATIDFISEHLHQYRADRYTL
jgi:NAD dependent epimerase/dehydratase